LRKTTLRLFADAGQPQPNGFAVDVTYEQRTSDDPVRAGGDVVCINYSLDGSVLVTVVDLAAKAYTAARQAKVVRDAFRIAVARGSSPRLIMCHLNASLLAYGEANRTWFTFGTGLVLKCLVDGGVVYASAGAEPAILFRGPQAHEHFAATGPVIGLDREWSGTEAYARFSSDETIIAYTDGITESRSASNRRTFLGTSGLVSTVRRTAVAGQFPSCRSIMDAIEKTWNQCRFLDDATLVVVSPCRNR
jgi:serine phosphatase RsbU (regulator of sigma subunit)